MIKRTIYILIFLLGGIVIQAQELLDYPLDTVNGEEVYKYEVEKSIGLYRIGVNFNVSQTELVRLNPQLRERGLHFGETLLIPTGRKVEKKSAALTAHKPALQETERAEERVWKDLKKVEELQEAESLKGSRTESASAVADSTIAAEVTVAEVTVTDSIVAVTDSTVVDSVAVKGKVVELALLLPFESQQTKRSGNAERMMEFYQGALLALHVRQNDSVIYRLRVYDTERSERRVNGLCEGTELDSVRGILGPVYPIQIARLTEWSESRQVPVLLPFSDDVSLYQHRSIYQFNSPDADEAKALKEWIAMHLDSVHCVAVQVGEADMSGSIRSLHKELREAEIPYSSLTLRDLLSDSVGYALDKTKENLLILHNDRYQHVRILMPHLASLEAAGYRVRIVSQYSWQKEAINLPQVYTTKFEDRIDRSEYDALWSQYYVNEHVSDAPRYDLLGYDLMNELIHIVTGAPSVAPLQSPIVWESTREQDGWQNTYVKVVED